MKSREARLFEEAVTIIGETLHVPKETITEKQSINSLSEDSIRLFELLLAFEKKYHIKTTYEDVINLETVGDIVAYLVKQPSIE